MDVIITDLPGIYSLSPYTLEEVVARNYLVHERPDVILNIVDGTNLERNLLPYDPADGAGHPRRHRHQHDGRRPRRTATRSTPNAAGRRRWSARSLRSPPSRAMRSWRAAEAAIEAAKQAQDRIPLHTFYRHRRACHCAYRGSVQYIICPKQQQRWYAIKIFERDDKVLEQLKLNPQIAVTISKRISRLPSKRWTTMPNASSPTSAISYIASADEALLQEKGTRASSPRRIKLIKS